MDFGVKFCQIYMVAKMVKWLGGMHIQLVNDSNTLFWQKPWLGKGAL